MRKHLLSIAFVAGFSGLLITGYSGAAPAIIRVKKRMTFESIPDTPQTNKPVELPYPIEDRTGNFVTDQPVNPFYLKDPPAIEKDVQYDPASGMYVVTEKMGGKDVRPPMFMSYADYLEYTAKEERNAYWKERSSAINLIEERGLVPPIQIKKKFFDKLFGGSKIEIKPQGNVEVTLGGNTQRTQNPNIPIRNQRTGGFDFDMNINASVIGKIGDKLQLGIKYNTQSGFQLDNQIKLGYAGDQDDIIRNIDVGNVSLPLNTQLITGSQSLFGVKATLQFGRLTWTGLFSQQQSRRESIRVENGSQRQVFEIQADQYEENRHFFLGQFFRDQYDFAMAALPNIRSVVNVTRVEVWVTNRNGATLNVRDVVGFADLGEFDPYAATVQPVGNDPRPANANNDLYNRLVSSPTYRTVDNVSAILQSPAFLLRPVEDYEKTYARKLNESEYVINRQLGYISLNSQMNPNDVLSVAYQYEYNGQVYQVGEFSNQVPPDSNATSKVLFLKMLKSTSIRPRLPYWNLMMKNIYSIGGYQIGKEDFRLDIYYNDPGGGEKRYLPKGNIKGVQLLRIENLDNVNMNGDPQQDGLFDFLPNITINPTNGRLMFPVVEPFGDHLRKKMEAVGDGGIANQFVYDQLYDSTRFIAQQFPEFNRFVIKGQYRGTNSSEISLGGKVPRGSVVVSAGGQRLTEGTHYTINYDLGRLSILDPAIANSGKQIQVDFENTNQFATQVRSMIGTRLDYRVNPSLNIGATIMNMRERPFTQKVNVGEDPINNLIMGADVTYNSNAPWLTKALDKLPGFSTKEMSTISAYGEVAYLKPGHNRAINGTDNQGQVYVDDFEGTSVPLDLRGQPATWKLASTPREAKDASGRDMFPEASLTNDYRYGFNRSRIGWYRIDNSYFAANTSPDAVFNNKELLSNHFVRLINNREVYPNRPFQSLDPNIYTFDLAFYPKERGPYNFEFSGNPTTQGGTVISQGIDSEGKLKDPQSRWAGVMKSLESSSTDLEATNVEFIEFWMLDPFVYNPTSQGGKLYFNLGNVSEDVLKDSRYFYENGMTADGTNVDQTTWGNVPRLPPLVTTFDNDANLRPVQDVGFDGLTDDAERNRLSSFLTNVQSTVTNPAELSRLQADPSSDNFQFHQDPALEAEPNILVRYKNFNNPQGNSPVQTNSAQTSTASTSIPESEDFNRDNTLSENEEYFQYAVDLRPGMDVGTNPYIVSRLQYPATTIDGVSQPPWSWYQFRIPIRDFETKVGNIPDFKSIQFVRMYLTGWQDSVILRFATLELVRNQWRTYNLPLNDPCENLPTDGGQNTFYNLASVSIEENSAKTPVNYVLPPAIQREQQVGNQTNQIVAQNEQALAMTVCNLQECKMKAVFKNSTLDLRRYKSLKMFIHANRVDGSPQVQDDDVTAVFRIGSDFKDNYYQYEVPLKITPDGQYSNDNENDRKIVWPEANEVNFVIQDFVNLKQERNANLNYPRTVPFKKTLSDGRIISIVGNPDLGDVKTMMLGARNPSKDDPQNPKDDDDGQPKCVELWFNELRASGFEEFGGTAAVANVSIKLADLGTVNVSGRMHTRGFGQVEQRIDQRFKDDMYQYDASVQLQLGRLFGEKAGIQLPFYGSYAETFSMPEFDPYQFDISTKDVVNSTRQAFGDDSARTYRRQIQTIQTRRGYNFSNVRFVPKTKSKKPQIWDPGNFNFTWAYTEIINSDPFIEKNSRKNYVAAVNWAFSPQPKDWYPFKKLIKSKSKWLDLIRDFNVNPIPSTLSVSNDWNREFGEIKLRSLGEADFPIPTTYNKFFLWNRSYQFKYNPFKSLSIDYTAANQGRVDEPDGLLDSKAKQDTMWQNFWKGGRNTAFNQQFGVNYNIPINKLPLFDWITASVGYNATYNWTALPQVRDSNGVWQLNPFGNIITNTQGNKAKIDFNLKKVYDLVPFLKVYNSPNPSFGDKKEMDKKRETARKARTKIKEDIDKLKEKRDKLKEDWKKLKADTQMDSAKREKEMERIKQERKTNRKAIRAKRKELRNKQMPANPGISLLIRPLLMIKKISVDYKENKSTTLNGFTGDSRIFGTDYKLKSPDWGFAFGTQPGDRFFYGADKNARQQWLDDAAANGWIVRDTLLNSKFLQTRSQRLDVTATLEPIPDLKIDLNMFVDYTKNYSETFKVRTEGGDFEHLNPQETGTYSISYVPVQTLFNKVDGKGFTDTYRQFLENRKIISSRLGDQNPNNQPGDQFFNPADTTGLFNPNYRYGYGPKSQDVLIPAFLAAYLKTDANKIGLNPFQQIPLPNWRISYNGLSKINVIKKVFSNINFTHGYTSTLSVSSFNTNLDYRGGDGLFQQQRLDTLNGNYFTFYTMPNIVLNEQFSPLIGVDMTFKNNLSVKFDYKKSRTMTMGFADYQLVENQQEGVTVGAGYKIKGLKLPIKIRGKKLRLDNELNFRFDFTYRDNITINYRIDESIPQITSGARVYTIQPSIDYVVNKRLNVRIFFDQTKTIPKISTGFPTTNTRGGITLRFSLTD